MILEVNNTFDERRMYFLTPDTERLVEDGHPEGREHTAGSAAFTQTWPKDFHVSPFNSRKGTYSVSATDPLRRSPPGTSAIDNTIVLRSSKSHGKLVARLFSDGLAVDPEELSLLQKLKFLVSWSWVGFVTFPRIVKEAGALFFKRKLHVWFRPEPLKESIGRRADATEQNLERVFRRYLRHLTDRCDKPLAVKYTPGGVADSSHEMMLSSPAKAAAERVDELELKVLTPVFYSRFVHYAHDLEALFCELRESNTVWVSRPELLPALALRKPPPVLRLSSPLDFVLFKAIQYLRRRPERIERPATWPTSSRAVEGGTHSVTDIRGFRISAMDGYVLAEEDRVTKSRYRISVLKLFIADRIALGNVSLVESLWLILRVWVAHRYAHEIAGAVWPMAGA